MLKSITALAATSVLLVPASIGLAASDATDSQLALQRTRLVETDQGSSFEVERSVAPDPGPDEHDPATAPAATNARGAGNVIWQTNVTDAIYTSTAVVGSTGRLAAGTYLNDPRKLEVTPLDGAGVPDWEFAGTELRIEAAQHADVIAGIDRVGSGMTVYKWHTGSAVPDWSFPITSSDPASYETVAVSDDGSTIAILVTVQGSPIKARLYYFDSGSGTPLGSYDAPDGTFARNVDISANGQYIAFIALADVYVLNRDTGGIRWSGNMGATSDALALSGDGNTLAYGWTTFTVRQWDGSIYAPAWTTSNALYRVLACDISGDSGTLAVGWYRTDYLQNRIQLFDLPSSVPAWTYLYAVGSGGQQDEPAHLALTTDGGYLAVGSWGDQANTNPEIEVFSHADPDPILLVDTPGSIFDIDIRDGEDGVRVAACGKHIHANTSGRGGDLYSIQVLNPAAAPEGLPSSVRTVSAQPNPFRPGGSLLFAAPGTARRLEIHGVDGRVVRSLTVPSGTGSVRWDGATDAGVPAPAGVYWLRWSGQSAGSGRFVMIR